MFWLLIFIQLITAVSGFTVVQQAEDIDKIDDTMKKIFQQHVDKKVMDIPLLKNAYKNYIEQFDPTHVYLLEKEVQPYIAMNDNMATRRLAEYRRHDFSGFQELNEVIQHAIQRARTYRKSLLQNPDQLAKEKEESLVNSTGKQLFASDVSELQNRIHGQILLFIQEERNRLGTALINQNLAKTLAIYNDKLEEWENLYLPSALVSRKAGTISQRDLLTLHILKALSSSLDPHTDVLDESEAYQMRLRLEKSYKGIGIAIEQQGKKVIISSLIPEGPAAKSGLVKVNDQIVSINNLPIAGMSLDQVLGNLREGNNPNIYLELERPDEKVPRVIQLKRELIPVDTGRVEAAYEKFGNGIIGLLALHSFYQGLGEVSSVNDLRHSIQNLQKEGNLRGLLIDMRDNTGGFLTQAIKMVGLFINSGIVVISKYANGETVVYRDIDRKVAYKGPLVILTSRETASAAEIVAEALQDYGVAIIVGDDHTYGKGTIQSQTFTEEGDHALFKVTVGKYYTVSGKSPQLQGVKADVVIPGPLSNSKIGESFYADAETAPPIPPEYVDPLTDVPASKKDWYKQYYLPTMQHHITQWQDMIPTLRKNSATRVAHNKDYQHFLEATKAGSVLSNESVALDGAMLQLEEGINILKDMITLEAQLRGIGQN